MKASEILITIERDGQFPVGWTHSYNHQCGNVGTPILSFKAKIAALACDCNKDGWIIDNNGFPSYFREKYQHVTDFQSCEHIAKQAVVDFKAQIEADGVKPQSIEVAVSGIPGSWITASWHARDERDKDERRNGLLDLLNQAVSERDEARRKGGAT